MSQTIYSVSSLVHYIKETLDHDFQLQSILIKGEISNFTNHRSGHWYFTLKDGKSKISCVMFASYASRCKILLKEGMKVIVSASVSMYEAGGSMQLYVTQVQADGIGDLFLQLEQVKEKLSKEGLFSMEHKKQLPTYPMRIAVITAKTGAAIQDILTTISRRWPIADVQVYPTLVQGATATKTIVEQLLIADKEDYDVILLARGGGAIEDLWCFNEELLARTIYGMKTVIVTGVGHESDTTLVDYVSDVRAATPTAAAERITPDILEVRQHLHWIKKRLCTQLKTSISQQRQNLTHAKEFRYLKDPLSYIAQEQMKLAMHVKELGIVDQQAKRLASQLRSASHQLAMHSEKIRNDKRSQLQKERIELQTRMVQFKQDSKQCLKEKIILLDAYSPLKVLGRGYHITYHDGHVVKSMQDVKEHDEITIRMQDGLVFADVVEKEIVS